MTHGVYDTKSGGSSMAWSRAAAILLVVVAAVLSPAAATLSTRAPLMISVPNDNDDDDGLSYDFHGDSCPKLQEMVSTAVKVALKEDASLAAGLLRLFFHDCFPQGCDASILLTRIPRNELYWEPNRKIQPAALHLIDHIRAQVHAACGPTVSCADISALATLQAVVESGGPAYDVPLGRLDSLRPASKTAVHQLPGPDMEVHRLIKSFQSRLLDRTDLVALSGAHTIGKAHRASYVRNLTRHARKQDLDVSTPDVFDNKYYSNLREGKGVLNSDMALTRDVDTSWWVGNFAQDQAWFFGQFSTSMSKLAHLLGPHGNVGEIRNSSCFSYNDWRPGPIGHNLTAASCLIDDATGRLVFDSENLASNKR